MSVFNAPRVVVGGYDDPAQPGKWFPDDYMTDAETGVKLASAISVSAADKAHRPNHGRPPRPPQPAPRPAPSNRPVGAPAASTFGGFHLWPAHHVPMPETAQALNELKASPSHGTTTAHGRGAAHHAQPLSMADAAAASTLAGLGTQ